MRLRAGGEGELLVLVRGGEARAPAAGCVSRDARRRHGEGHRAEGRDGILDVQHHQRMCGYYCYVLAS